MRGEWGGGIGGCELLGGLLVFRDGGEGARTYFFQA